MPTLMKRYLAAFALLPLGGCPEPQPDPEPEYAEVATNIAGGVLLSAAPVGDDVLLVGGELSSQPGVTAGGPGYVLRWRDGELCREAVTDDHTLWWIAATSPDEWYAVGDQGTILHQQGGTLHDESVTTDAVLYGVFDQGDRVVAVGGDVWNTDEGEVWTRDASGTWTLLAGQLPGVAFKVWEDWIVGVGVAWTLEGDTLVERHPPDNARLLTVHGSNPDDVWAVGGQQQPVLLHWEGDAWASVAVDPLCANSGLNGVWVSPEGDVWITGFFGAIGRLRDGEWSCPEAAVTREHFHAVVGHGDEQLFVGGDLFGAGDNYGTIVRFGAGVPQVATPLPAC